MKTDFKKIGTKIRELRESRGMSQQSLAAILGYQTDTAISLIESGERKLSIEKLLLISETFNVPVNELLGKMPHSDVKVALRAEKGLTESDKQQIVDFIEFIKNKSDAKG